MSLESSPSTIDVSTLSAEQKVLGLSVLRRVSVCEGVCE